MLQGGGGGVCRKKCRVIKEKKRERGLTLYGTISASATPSFLLTLRQRRNVTGRNAKVGELSSELLGSLNAPENGVNIKCSTAGKLCTKPQRTESAEEQDAAARTERSLIPVNWAGGRQEMQWYLKNMDNLPIYSSRELQLNSGMCNSRKSG